MPRPNELSIRQQAMVSAALRHVRDAEHLATPGPGQSLDQAFHLAGFGPECMRKALLSDQAWNKILGHRFDDTMEETLETILSLDAVARRYAPQQWGRRWPAMTAWSEQARYEKTGKRRPPEVRRLLDDAADAVHTALADLWADGRLPERFSW